MSDAKKCAQCGAVLTPGATEGLCPACLLIRGLETQSGGGVATTDFTQLSPEELGHHFPQLEILELLGRGGMGVVYKARQRNLERPVALKILAAPAKEDPAFEERFSREALALARLSHPNIVAVYDLGRTDGLYYFLMEYVDGVNLRQLLNTAQITPDEAIAIIPQICEALQYAHEQGIVHRDIKPENILIDKNGQVKIADFGLAKIVGREGNITLTASGATMGTPAYMAPEQIERPQEVDHRADIYSMGVVFYQMLTGELPMGRFAPPSKKVQIDVRLDEVVLRALEKEPDMRWQQASDVKTEVETIVSTPPPVETSTQPIHVAGAGEGLKKKSHAWLLAAAVILIAAAGAVAVYKPWNKSASGLANSTAAAPQSPLPVTAPAQPSAAPSAIPAPVSQEQGTLALLLSGKWHIKGKVDHGTWYIAEFHADKTVTVTKASGAVETHDWLIDGDWLSIIYANHRDIFYLPLDPAGTNGQGRTQGFIAEREPQTGKAELDLLFAGPWKFAGMNVSAVRVFNSDGSFTTNGNAAASGRWQAGADKIELVFQDGHKETMELPLNPKGTSAADEQGNAMIASQQKTEAAASPSPVATAGNAVGDPIKLLLAGPWTIIGATWSATRTFYENGTFTSEPGDSGKWRVREGGIDLYFDNGNHDTLKFPLDVKGALGADTHGFPCIAYLLVTPLPPQQTAGASPAAGGMPEEETINLLTSGPWKMRAIHWSATRTFRKDGSFFSENNQGNGRGKWKISGKFIELSFEDGHTDTLELPLNPAGTRGMGGEDGLGYATFLADPTGMNAMSPIVVPGSQQEADAIKLLTSGPWIVRGGNGIRTFNADGTFAEHAAKVDPVMEPGLVLRGKWRINGDQVEMFVSDSIRYTMSLPLNPRGTFGEFRMEGSHPMISYLPSAVKAPVSGVGLVPQPPGPPTDSTIPLSETEMGLENGAWHVIGVNWEAAIGSLRANGKFDSMTDYTNGKSFHESGTWTINGDVFWLVFQNGRKCAISLPLGWKKSPGVSSDGYAVLMYAQDEPTGLSRVQVTDTAQLPASVVQDAIKLLTSGTWRVSGVNWFGIRTFRANGTFTSVQKGGGQYVSDREVTLNGRWTITGPTVQLSLSSGGKETMKLPIDPKGTPGVDSTGGATLTYLQPASGPQIAMVRPTPTPQKLSPLNVKPPPTGAVRDTPAPRSVPFVPAPELIPNPSTYAPVKVPGDTGNIEERTLISAISAEGQQKAADFLKAHRDGLIIVKGKDAQGSAFVTAMSGSNCMVTNVHIFTHIPDATFETFDGVQVQPGQASIATDRDLYISAAPAGGTPLELSQDVTKDAVVGDEVAVFGNADGEGVVRIVTGKVIGVGAERLEIDAPFGPDLSGSPIVDLNSGKVVAVATYDFFREDAHPTLISRSEPVAARRFGLRLDTVKAWEPVSPAAFATQASTLRGVEALTGDLYDMCATFSAGMVHIDPGTIASVPVRDAVAQWVQANSTTRTNPQVRRDSALELYKALKDATGLGMAAARQQMTYGYFKMEFAREQEYRDTLAKWFEQAIKGLQNQDQNN